MKKRFTAILGAAVLSCLLSGCSEKLDGKWDICTEKGDSLTSIRFYSDDMEMKMDGEKGRYSILDNSRIKFKWDDDDVDEKYGGRFDYEILDKGKMEIYIEDFSEIIQNEQLEQRAKELEVTASNIMKAVTSAICELDEEGIDTGGYWVYSSDEGFCMIPSSINADELNKKVKKFFSDIEKTSFILTVNRSIVKEVYVSDSWHNKCYGAYSYDAGHFSGTDKTLEDIAGNLIG